MITLVFSSLYNFLKYSECNNNVVTMFMLVHAVISVMKQAFQTHKMRKSKRVDDNKRKDTLSMYRFIRLRISCI